MIKPITPNEIAKFKKELIPDKVIEVINNLIAEKFSRNEAVIKQEDIINRLKEVYTEKQIIYNGWLNIEEIYEDAGWKVTYDSPAYNENYPPSFTFKIKK